MEKSIEQWTSRKDIKKRQCDVEAAQQFLAVRGSKKAEDFRHEQCEGKLLPQKDSTNIFKNTTRRISTPF